jgi:hypothetical protein
MRSAANVRQFGDLMGIVICMPAHNVPAVQMVEPSVH